ncbi:STAS domain-containing protein [Halanaerobacter jeridensis]|uniref:Anti-sigma factor antagonist n=1 Tax=Halanaerobacter jeridensis TaxID=706427 RepID=A0A939BPJ8_9FIRM|nr:anti-sigma factor antagonist [Halanaerobacter jeridensis]MBM7555264.1 stage II sporulation protein AA (anti-sigma F factor antagonist) [Halanaerobacter jeridensis]
MKLIAEKITSNLIVRINGNFDLHTAEYFKKQISSYLKKEINNLILDLQSIDVIDSSGIGAILSIYKKIKKRGGKIVIININPTLKRIFELSGLLNIIKVYSSQREALEKLQRR